MPRIPELNFAVKPIENQLRALPGLSPLDLHFAAFMGHLAPGSGPELWLGAYAASVKTGARHACAYLPALAGELVVEEGELRYPELEPWLAQLQQSPVVGQPGDFRPLILDGAHRLYLYRYWRYEQDLAEYLLPRLAGEISGNPAPDVLERLFGSADAVDWQKLAAVAASLNRFTVISGGPGTGKTSTVIKLLALLLEQGPCRIALAAPTGKAAARMKEAIQRGKAALRCSAAVREAIPEQACTLHRLLGYRAGSVSFRHQAGNLLPYDVIVVDEASMIDLALMAKLLEAVPPSARLVLLGDKDQLASVEAGNVLGDICQLSDFDIFSPGRAALFQQLTSGAHQAFRCGDSPVHDAVLILQQSYRFDDRSGIGNLARAINARDTERARQLLADPDFPDISLEPLPKPGELVARLRPLLLAGLAAYLAAPTPELSLAALESLRILCAVRRGPYGVENLNLAVEKLLLESGQLDTRARGYHRKPVMVAENDYGLQVFNGDVGILWEEQGTLRAWFQMPDGQMKAFLPSRLPRHETAWAMTVHKSQGSEFGQVLLVLPDKESPLLTRELVYTGITRARMAVTIWSAEAILAKALVQQVLRYSGLADRLAD